jgi:hypothetical protein
MSIIYFAAGLLSASIIAYVWFRINKKFNSLYKTLEYNHQDLYRYLESQERNMDNRINDIYQVLSEIERRFETPTKQQLNG